MKLTVEFLLFSALLLAFAGGKQEFLDQPENITVREGGEVRLNCVVNNKLGTLQWTRDDFGLGTSRELAGYSRLENILILLSLIETKKQLEASKSLRRTNRSDSTSLSVFFVILSEIEIFTRKILSTICSVIMNLKHSMIKTNLVGFASIYKPNKYYS